MDAFESRLASAARKAIEDLIESRTRSVVNGLPSNFDRYREDVGFLKGLGASLEAIDDARKAILQEERA